jgi:hypothetical protein
MDVFIDEPILISNLYNPKCSFKAHISTNRCHLLFKSHLFHAICSLDWLSMLKVWWLGEGFSSTKFFQQRRLAKVFHSYYEDICAYWTLKVGDTLTKYFSLNHLPKLCNIFNYNLKCKFEASKQSWTKVFININ